MQIFNNLTSQVYSKMRGTIRDEANQVLNRCIDICLAMSDGFWSKQRQRNFLTMATNKAIILYLFSTTRFENEVASPITMLVLNLQGPTFIVGAIGFVNVNTLMVDIRAQVAPIEITSKRPRFSRRDLLWMDHCSFGFP